jgi:general secretion pathway protein B
MSFILDALKKSESERQRQSTPGFADVPTRVTSRRPPGWLWIVAILLIINFAVLLGLYFRPAAAPVTALPTTAVAPEPIQALPEAAPVTGRLPVTAESAERAEIRTLSSEVVRPAAENTDSSGSVTVQATPESKLASSADEYSHYPSFTTLLANGTLQLADLHIDIHVYSSAPEERFVFINMNKYREGEQLSEGPQLHAITNEGVVLDYLGKRFILNRD